MLSLICQTAVDSEIARANPCARIKLPKRAATRKRHALTPTQVEQLARAIRRPYDMLVRFAAYSGLRYSELAALRAGNLDLDECNVTVEEAFDDKDRSFGPTKTPAAKRTIHIPAALAADLAAYLDDRAQDPDALVFTSPRGKPLHYKNVMDRRFKPAIPKANAALARHAATAGPRGQIPPEVAMHDLRHTCASLLILVGWHPKRIQRHLGHEDFTITMNTYSHLYDDDTYRIAATLQELYVAARQGRAIMGDGGRGQQPRSWAA